MDRLTAELEQELSAIDDAERGAARHWSARCAGMTVTWFERMAETAQEQVRDAIRILIPGELGAFDAVFRTPDGRLQRVFVRAPHVSVIPAGQPHSIRCVKQSDLIVIELDAEFFAEKVNGASGREPPVVVARPAALDFFLREAGNAIKRELRMPKAAGRAYFESLAGVLAIHLAGNYADPGTAVPVHCGLPPHKLNRVLAFIDEHLAEAMPVKQLADHVHMSPYHFARMFRRATGRSPHAYITLQRVERAKRLLSDTNLPLVEVGARVGFQTQAHFTGVFHRYAGVTPRIFRLGVFGACREAASGSSRTLAGLAKFNAASAANRVTAVENTNTAFLMRSASGTSSATNVSAPR
jgi:AraC family transcriptional regulator